MSNPSLAPIDSGPPANGLYQFTANTATKASNNSPAIQTAIDVGHSLVPIKGDFAEMAVRIPDGVFYATDPIYIDENNTSILGSTTSSIMMPNGYSLFVVGLCRSGNFNNPDISFRPDLTGRLDSTAGKRNAIRTKGDLSVVSMGSLFTAGIPSVTAPGLSDRWFGVRKMTIEFQVSGTIPDGATLFGFPGANTTQYTVAPFVVTGRSRNTLQLSVCTQPFRFSHERTTSNFQIPLPSSDLNNVAICLDMDNLACYAFANEVQVGVNGKFAASGYLNENDHAPFKMNCQFYLTYADPYDFQIEGLCFSNSLRYVNGGAGSPKVAHPQIAADGDGWVLTLPGVPIGTCRIGNTTVSATASAQEIQAAISALPQIGSGNVTVSGPLSPTKKIVNYRIAPVGSFKMPPASPGMCDGSGLSKCQLPDIYKFFPVGYPYPNAYDPYCMSFLALNDPIGQRHIKIQGGAVWQNRTSAAWLINKGCLDKAVTDIEIKNLNIQMGQGFGDAIHIFNGLNVKVDNCHIVGGAHGWGTMPVMANYGHAITNSKIMSDEAAVHTFMSSIKVMNTEIGGREGFKGVGTDATLDGISCFAVAPETISLLSFHDAGYGGKIYCNDFLSDYEGVTTQLAHVYCESVSYTETELYLNSFYIGTLGAAPIVMLRSPYGDGSHPYASVVASQMNAYTSGPVVDCDNTNWIGDFKRCFTNRVTQHDAGPLKASTDKGRSRVVVHDDFNFVFPRYGTYTPNNYVVNVAASDGCYRRWIPAASGTVGTDRPTLWHGLEPVVSDPSSTLAGYALDHNFITLNMSGVSSSFGLVSSRCVNYMGAKLAGNNIVVPSSYYAVLFNSPTTRGGQIGQIRDSGYKPFAFDNSPASFSAAASGTKTLTAPLSFGPFASDGVFYSFGIVDSNNKTTFNTYASVQLAKPYRYKAGEVFTIPSGAVVFRHRPYKGTQIGCMTEYWWGKMWDQFFGGVDMGKGTLAVTLADASGETPGLARVPLDNLQIYGTNYFLGQDGDIKNKGALTFGATPASGRADRFEVRDALTGGHAIWGGPLTNPVEFDGQQVSFDVGALQLAIG